jgi:hypothetical protein
MRHNTVSFAALSVLMLTSACGGGGSVDNAPTGTTPTTPTSTVTDDGVSGIFDDPQTQTILPDRSGSTSIPFYDAVRSIPNENSYLKGVMLRQNNVTGVYDLPVLAGMIGHNTGETTITDGRITMTDNDGFNGSGVATDGTVTFSDLGTTGSYDYVILVSENYADNGVSYDATGVVGIRTEVAQMPLSSTASYSGETEATLIMGAQGYDLRNGSSQINVNFNTSRLDVDLSGFTATNIFSQTVTTAPVDQIKGTGLVINGNGFSGGTFTTLKNGSVVNVTGSNTSTLSGGAFLGYDVTNSMPDEIGGVVLMKGQDGTLSAWYVAD